MPETVDPAAVRYDRMRWNTPLSEEHAELLLRRLDVRPGASLLDLGCGWGELLLRAVAGSDGATAVGVDTDTDALERGRRAAAERSLPDVTFVREEATAWQEPADRVFCLGSSHVLGGTVPALEILGDLVRPGGRLLFGDAYWQRPPSAEAVEIFGDQTMSLPELVEQIRLAGWRVLHFSTADQREWDDFESTFRAARQEWLLDHPDDSRADDLRDALDTQLREYVGVYRGVLGMGYFVLGR
ncbi:SAM-dependent methyltransferase [Plantactinospora alkalitolerans]|nr:methyltransferase domain-containing protein [Plantactinospora alkalitolerans]